MAGEQVAANTAPLSLAEQRRRRGISLDAIAQATKISRHFLEAIETEAFEKLPGGIFNRSYIRQYAAFTGIGELGILDRYIEFTDAAARASLPPAFGMSRLRHALYRTLNLFAKERPAAAEAQPRQHIGRNS